MTLHLQSPLEGLPEPLKHYRLDICGGGLELVYTYDTQSERTGITSLLSALGESGIRFKDLSTTQSSLEEIFVSLVKRSA
jgi:ABC-2 type transport system ATP-binding protein